MPLDANLFIQGAALQNQNNQQLLQSLQGGFDNAYKMKSLKLEQDKAKQSGLDLDKLASAALIKANLDPKSLTDQDYAVLKAFDTLETRKLAQDQAGNYRKVNGSIFDTLQNIGTKYEFGPNGISPDKLGSPQGLNGPQNVGPQGQGSNPALSLPYDQIKPLDLAGVEEQLQGTPVGNQGLNVDALRPKIQVPPELSNNPAATQKYLESAATEKAKVDAEKQAAGPKAESSLKNYVSQQQNINNTIDKAVGKTGWLSAGALEGTKDIGGTPAANLEALLNTVAADSAFSELQAMRDASKTGGALGGVSERELALLSSAKAALGQKQSPEQLKENLKRYKEIRNNALKNVKEAYVRDYGKLPPDLEKPQNPDGIASPQTDEDYNSLPSGAIFIDPDDGKKYRKP